MRIKKGFVLRDVCGETVIVGEGLEAIDFGKLLVLNDTAVWLWNEALRQKEFSIESLTDAICEEYDVEKDIAKADIAEVIKEWMDINMLEN